MFVVLLTYIAPLDAVDRHLPAHRDFLARQYAAGIFLLSGRKEPREGGVIIARAASRSALEEVLAEDPFHVHGLARYEIVQFTPTMAGNGLHALLT